MTDTDLPDRVLYTIVIARTVYAGIATSILTYIVGTHVIGWPSPSFMLPPITMDYYWFGLFVVVAFATVALGYWLWMILSWVTAYVIHPSVRRADLSPNND